MDPHTKYPLPPFPKQIQDVPGQESEMKPKADHGEESYKGSGKLKDKIAIITFGDSGIGRAIAIAYAREGADVLISYGYESEDEDAAETAEWVKEAGRKVVLIKGDVQDEQHCQEIVKLALKNSVLSTSSLIMLPSKWRTRIWKKLLQLNGTGPSRLIYTACSISAKPRNRT